MTPHRPFAFDNDFSGDTAVFRSAEPRRKRAYLADEVEAIRADALAAGEVTATARAQAAAAAAVAELAAAARQGLQTLEQAADAHKAVAAELALAAARIIAAGALERFPMAPVTAALEALGREIDNQPRLIVRLADPHAAGPAVEAAAREIGYPGQIVLKAQPGPAAAFVLDWGDGQAAYDPATAAARIAEAFAAALAAGGSAQAPATLSPGG